MSKLIVLEGPDGCGKTTQTPLVVEKLNSLGHNATSMVFPSKNNPVGDFVQDIFRNDAIKTKFDITTDMGLFRQMLFAFDRFNHRSILSMEHDVEYIVLDRYSVSNYVYVWLTCGGAYTSENIKLYKLFKHLEENVLFNILPFKTIYLDMTVDFLKQSVQAKRVDNNNDIYEKEAYASRTRGIYEIIIEQELSSGNANNIERLHCYDSMYATHPINKITELIVERIIPGSSSL